MKKKKILFVLSGWVPHNSGGVISYVYDLYNFLDKDKYDIYIFTNGSFSLFSNRVFVKKYKNIYKLFNYKYFFSEEECPIEDNNVNSLFKDVILEINPEIVHFHDLVGLPLSLIKISKNYSNARIFCTFHNYVYICRRHTLLHDDGKICIDCQYRKECFYCKGERSTIYFFYRKYRYIIYILLKENLNRKFYNHIISFYEKVSFINKKNKNTKRKPVKIINKNSERAQYSIDILDNCVDLNFCVSSEVKRIYKNFGVKNVKVLHIGTKTLDLINKSNKKLNRNNLIFGFIGTEYKEKGLLMIISVFEKILKLYPSFSINIYGTTRESFINKNNYYLEDNPRMKFYGKYDYSDLNRILNNIDIAIVSPMYYDPSPLVVKEILASETPIIGANIGGISDFVKDNKTGLLFNFRDENDLRRKIECVIKNPDIINEFKKNKFYKKSFNDHLLELDKYYL